MNITLLKSKIHRAKITDSSLNYVGSFSIDRDLMDLVGLIPYEKILISNMATGHRFETYVIEAPRQSRSFVLNGATARLGTAGDLVTIFSFASMSQDEAKEHKPNIATLDENNNIAKIVGGNDAG